MTDEKLYIEVITPVGTAFGGFCDMVVARTVLGEMGILKGHLPVCAILADGALRIINEGIEKNLDICGGFLEVLRDKSVVVSAENAVPA